MLVAFAGLPGSGKSSVAKLLAAKKGISVFCEPEEPDWPELIHNRHVYGHFTGLSWFRLTRVQLLFKAAHAARRDGCSVIDSYYDVLIHHYLGKPEFHWLIKPTDPYFVAAKEVCAADYQNLPKADVIIFLRVDLESWKQMLDSRGRRLDRDDNLKAEFGMQEEIWRACLQTSVEHGSRLVEARQQWGSISETVEMVSSALSD